MNYLKLAGTLIGICLLMPSHAYAIPQTFDLNVPVGVIELNPDAFGPIAPRFTTVTSPTKQQFESLPGANAKVDIGDVTKATTLTTAASSLASASVYYQYFTTAAFLTVGYTGFTNTTISSPLDGDASARWSIRMGALTARPKVTIESSTGTIIGFTAGRIDNATAEIVGQRQAFYSTGLDQIVTNHLLLTSVLGGPTVVSTSISNDSGFITVPTCPFDPAGFSGCAPDPSGRIVTIAITASAFGKNSFAIVDPVVSLPANELSAVLQPLGSLSDNTPFLGGDFLAALLASGFDPSLLSGGATVPEPSTLLLLGSGLLAFPAWKRRQLKNG